MRIRQFGDPILRTVCHSIVPEDITHLDNQKTITRMKDILDNIKRLSNENGNAIAAPQIGVTVRLILLRINNEFVPMINPTYNRRSEQAFEFEDECFSFYHLRGKVTRHSKVIIEYFDDKAQAKLLTLSGDDSALAQHEMDHLDGILFIDNVIDKHSIASIEFTLENSPVRLKQVKNIINYMLG